MPNTASIAVKANPGSAQIISTPRTIALETVRLAWDILESKKARDLVALDVRKDTAVTDYIVMASGASGPQLKAMAGALQQALKAAGLPPHRHSGEPDSGWIVLDCVDVVIHLFVPAVREYYALETLWTKAKPLPLAPAPKAP